MLESLIVITNKLHWLVVGTINNITITNNEETHFR